MTTTRRASAVLAAAAAVVVLAAGTASAAAPSVTMDPAGVLDLTGRSVTISGTYRCDFVPGGTERISPKVTQQTLTSVAQAQPAPFVVPCTGAVLPWSVVAPVITTSPLVPGPATGQVLITGSSGSASFTTAMVLA